MSYMRQTLVSSDNLVQELSLDEINNVDGGADAKVVSTGLTIMASSLKVGPVCPPAGGAIATIGLAVVVVGLLFD